MLLRRTLRLDAVLRGYTLLYVSYADPAAHDARSGLPLLGHVYLASGMFYIGDTVSPRRAFLDASGRVRSSRQGSVTLTRSTAPAGWRSIRLPAARIWAAVVAPNVVDGRATSTRWRKHQRRECWAALAPRRRSIHCSAATRRRWRNWHATLRVLSLGPSTSLRWTNERRPAWWQGCDLSTRAAPVWLEPIIQLGLELVRISAHQVEDERTAARTYIPLN